VYHSRLMQYLLPAVILAFCAPAVFVSTSRIPMILGLSAFALAVGAFGVIWGKTVSPAMLAAHPALLNSPLHPEISIPAGGIMVLFGIGLFLALGARALLLRAKILQPR
jgi:hypothetical protein